MSMVHCRACGKELHDLAVTCPHCGAPQVTVPIAPLKTQTIAGLWCAFLGGYCSSGISRLRYSLKCVAIMICRFIDKFLKISFLIVVLTLTSGQCFADVYPAKANQLKQVELGQAVLLFMPPQNSQFVDWAFQANGPVVWLTSSYSSNGNDATYREGLMRITVDGATSTILKHRVHELAWSVRYQGELNPSFGVQSITMEPGIDDGDANCFGAGTTGCSFNPLSSLIKAGVAVKILCQSNDAQNSITGLDLSASGKAPTTAQVLTSGGSGGESTEITLFVGDNSAPTNLCD